MMMNSKIDTFNSQEIIEPRNNNDIINPPTTKNNDDLISKEEFKEAMTIIGQFVWGESPTDADIEYMIKEADTDGDGFLHYSD